MSNVIDLDWWRQHAWNSNHPKKGDYIKKQAKALLAFPMILIDAISGEKTVLKNVVSMGSSVSRVMPFVAPPPENATEVTYEQCKAVQQNFIEHDNPPVACILDDLYPVLEQDCSEVDREFWESEI